MDGEVGSLVLAVCVMLFFVIAAKLLQGSRTATCPPAPRALPLIGHLHLLGWLPHVSFMKLSKEFGPLILLRLGYKTALVVSDVEIVKELFTSLDSIFVSRCVPAFGRTLLWNGRNVAFAPHGDFWREMKKLCIQHLLNNKHLMTFQASRLEEIEKEMKTIAAVSEANGTVVIKDHLCDITFNMMMRMMKADVDLESPEVMSFKDSLHQGGDFLTKFFFTDFFPYLGFLDWFKVLAMKRIQKKRDAFLDKIIAEKFQKLKAAGEDKRSSSTSDFIDSLVSLADTKGEYDFLTNEAIKALTMDMIGGAFHPSPGFMEWVFVEIMRHPAVLHELQNELVQVVQPGQLVTESELDKLPFLQAIIKETFRVHPPGPLLFPRLSIESTALRGYTIPENTELFVNVYATGRDPKNWEDPLEFRPWRFLSKEVDIVSGQSFELIPFGSGRRSCPGASFVLLHVELILANLFNSFDWELEEEKIDMEECFQGTLVKAKPLRLLPKLKIEQSKPAE